MKKQPQSALCSAGERQSWAFPLSTAGLVAELTVNGSIGPAELATLRRYLGLLESTITGDLEGPFMHPDSDDLRPGDIAQIRPAADPDFGGLMFRVCQVRPGSVRGYLLTAHRGGFQEAWLKYTAPELGRIGAMRWPEGEWGLNREEMARRRGLWHDNHNPVRRQA